VGLTDTVIVAGPEGVRELAFPGKAR
jgi:hypothetical protein